jgi:hypothetical protein
VRATTLSAFSKTGLEDERRIRPKIMTISVILAGLIPTMFSHGTGADVMKRIAVPMVGVVVPSFLNPRTGDLSRYLHDLAGERVQKRKRKVNPEQPDEAIINRN